MEHGDGCPDIPHEQGLAATTLKPGDLVKITFSPLRSGANGGLVLDLVSLDGKTIGKVK